MITGIGTDIIEIDRIARAIDHNKRFISKHFTLKEQDYFKERNNSSQSIAGNFAGKEAVSKALGTGFRGFGLIDIEILRDDKGAPIVFLHGQAAKIGKEKNIGPILVSIAHCENYAVAYALAQLSL